MGIDASIALQGKLPQFDNPLASLAQVSQIQGMQNQNQLAQYAISKAQRSDADELAQRNLLTGAGGDLEAGYNALLKGGYLEKAMAIKKQQQDQLKTTSEIGKNNAEAGSKNTSAAVTKMETLGQTLGALQQMPGVTPQVVATAIQHHADMFGIPADKVQASIASIPQDPAGLQAFLGAKRMEALKVADQMKFTTVDANTAANNRTSLATTGMNNQTTLATNAATNQTSLATNANTVGATIRGQDLTDGRSRDANANGKVPTGYRVNPDGTLSFIPGGPADPAAKAQGPASEDERKAAGWVSQAENAYKNMKAVMFDKDGKTLSKNVAPGMLENTAMGMGMPQAANTLRSPERQKFVQGASSLSEALLRAATGAGVNESEAKQKIEELTPQYTDKPEVRKQKLDAIPVYLESLKNRAGRALPKGATPAQQVKEAVENGVPDKLVNTRPAKVSNAADYAKLPTGTVYTAPDGSMRTKS